MLRNIDADLVSIVLFLFITLAMGLWYGKGVTSMQDYALGGRRFSTAALSATMIATWIGGGSFSFGISEIYTVGILAINNIGQVINLLLIAYILAPRMQEFLGKLSLPEVMGDLYGNSVRTITAVSSIIISAGFLASQIKVFSSVFNYFFGVHSFYATLISTMIVVIYSVFGGIRAVIFTDIFQFLTFGTFVPTLALLIWSTFGSLEAITHTLTTYPMFDPKLLLDFHDPTVLTYYGVFFYCLVPCFNPAMFQRVLIAQNTRQVSASFKVSAITFLFFLFITGFIGLVLLSVNPNIKASSLVMYIIDSYSYPGFKGLIVIGIAAMIMSTADSCINTASVIFVNDLCKPYKILRDDNVTELRAVRVFAVLVSIIALIMALSRQNLLGVILLGASFYTPVVGIPLLFTILGFRSSTRVMLSGMISGALAVIIWDRYYNQYFPIGNIMPATIVNFIVMMVMHYLLGEPGGWVGPKDRRPLYMIEAKKHRRRREISNFFKLLPYRLRWDHIVHYCYNNSFNLEKHLYIYFAISMALSLVTMLFADKANSALFAANLKIIIFFLLSSFAIVTALMTHKLWSSEFCRKYVGIVWHVAVFYILVFINTILALVGEFAQVPSICFLLNLMMMWHLVKWYIALFMIMTGIPLGILVFKIFNNHHNFMFFDFIVGFNLKFSVVCILLVIGVVVLMSFRPRQSRYKLFKKTDNVNKEMS